MRKPNPGRGVASCEVTRSLCSGSGSTSQTDSLCARFSGATCGMIGASDSCKDCSRALFDVVSS